MNRNHLIPSTALFAAIALALPIHAEAQLAYVLAFGVEYNDNINLSETNPAEETILRPSIAFSIDRTGSTVQADLVGTLEHQTYLEHSYDNNFRGHLTGTVNWVMVPNRLTWSFADALGVHPINQLAVDAPANRQQTNVFATGPTLFFRLGSTARGQAEMRYTTSHAEETAGFDSQRVGMALRGIKDLSNTSSVSLNLQAQRVRFDDSGELPPTTPNPDYDRYDAYLGYTRTLNQFDLALSAGYSWLRFDQRENEDDAGPLFDVLLGWRPTAQSSFTLDLGYRFTDAAAAMLGAGALTGEPTTDITTGDATVGGETFLERRIELGYHYEATRWSFTIAPHYRDLDYVAEPALDREGIGLRTSIGWALRPRLNLRLHASGEQFDYPTTGASVDHRRFGVTLDYRMTRNWSWHVNARHHQRSSAPAGFDVDQNVFYTWIAWDRTAR